jgi:hypothetical protein
MRVSAVLLLCASAASLELLTDNASGSWSETTSNTFQNSAPAHQNHAYKHNYLGQSSGGGLCSVGSAHLEAVVTMQDTHAEGTRSNTAQHIADRGNYAAIAMRADSASNSRGYECKISTEHGDNGISLTRDGKSINSGCPRIDQSNGVYNRYTSGYKSNIPGPYTFMNLCQIQERKKPASLFSKTVDYNLRMEIDENSDLNTVRVKCFVDDELKLFFTDPCPLAGGEFAIASKYQSTFALTDFTDTSCDSIPVPAVAAPSLADGLTLAGMGRTDSYWASSNMAASNSVNHRYAGGCNNGAFQGQGGLNREGGGRSNSALNVAALQSGACNKFGFITADITFAGDFMGNVAKVTADGVVDENTGNGHRVGNAGIAMRVDSSDTGSMTMSTRSYDSFGYMCQMDAVDGQVSVYRGRNGLHHNNNQIGSRYLTGRYRNKATCTCNDKDNCDQFDYVDGQLVDGAAHTLRLSVTEESDGASRIQCSLNGTTIVDVVDEQSGRHNWFPGRGRLEGPSAETNSCGDFGLVTSDHDIINFQVKDYTGYVAPTPAPSATGTQEVSFEIEVVGLTVAEVQSNLQMYKQALADALGIDVARISLSISTSRRLVEGNTGVTIVATVTASDTDTATASVVEAAVTAPTFATSVVTELQTAGVTVVLTVDTATISVAAASCSVQCAFNELLTVTHDTSSQHTHHRCYVLDSSCVCKCCNSATSDCTSISNYSL